MNAIAEPGVYQMSAARYHADPVADWSLCRSEIMHLMRVPFGGCPALYRWKRDQPSERARAFDLGHALHRRVLGEGAEIAVIDADDYRTKKARGARDRAYGSGMTPVLPHEMEDIERAAVALRAHPTAMNAFVNGRPEQTLIWQCPHSGVWMRCRPDWLPNEGRIVPDLKMTHSCTDEALERKIENEGLFVQAALIEEGIRALGLFPEPIVIFVFIEIQPPYFIRLLQLRESDISWGRIVIGKAKEVFKRCLATDNWPGYTTEIERFTMPYRSYVKLESAMQEGAFDVSHEWNRPVGGEDE